MPNSACECIIAQALIREYGEGANPRVGSFVEVNGVMYKHNRDSRLIARCYDDGKYISLPTTLELEPWQS